MFTLIDLPYPIDALEPVISARTLTFHHGKHLQGYVDNLNKLVAGTEFETMPLEEIVQKATGGMFNNAGQILNHNLYFTQFRPAVERSVPEPVEGPTGALQAQIVRQWGSLAAFQTAFVTAGATLFGSGWVWLSAAPDGTLVITQEPGASNPICRPVPEPVEGPDARLRPLLTFDVWEHAYYLDYQNRRPAHLEALWGIVDWSVVEERYGLFDFII